MSLSVSCRGTTPSPPDCTRSPRQSVARRNQTQPKRMIVLQPPMVRHFLEQHEVFQREIVCIIDNQTLGAVLVQVSHEFGLAGAPMPSEREAKRRKKLVAQCLFIVI